MVNTSHVTLSIFDKCMLNFTFKRTSAVKSRAKQENTNNTFLTAMFFLSIFKTVNVIRKVIYIN